MPFVSRPALLSDQEAIARLSVQWGYNTSQEEIASELGRIFQHPDHQVIVLQKDGVTTGWIHGIYSLRIASDPFVEIVGLVVDAQYRKMGMGRFLIAEIVKWAKSKNCSHIRVRCQIIRQEANIFYSRIGFRETKQQKVYDLFV
jgi:GNAT superfamily N-acetyltransferase